MPNILPFRLLDMFTAGSTSVMRQRILEQFSKKKTKLRVILATSAFGLGVDCPDSALVDTETEMFVQAVISHLPVSTS